MNITLTRDRFGITPPEITLNYEGTLLDYLIETFGGDGSDRQIDCFSEAENGDFSPIEKNYDALNARYDRVIIAQNPAGLEPVTWLWIAYAALAVASFVLIKPPRLNNQTEDSNRKQSPNNGLDGQTNLARRLQRIPEIFGKVKSYPDLINESVFRYVSQLKKQTEVFCIGRGYYQLDDFKSGDTLIADIDEAVLEIFQPFEAITDLEKFAVSTSVVDVSIPADNENFIDSSGRGIGESWEGAYDDSGTPNIGTIIDNGIPDAFDFIEVGDTVELDNVTFRYAPPNQTADVSGTYTVSAKTGNTISFENPELVSSDWTALLDGPLSPHESNSTGKIILDKTVIPGPFVVPGNDYSKIVFDIDAPRGIARGSELSSFLKIDFDAIVQEIDSDGNPVGLPATESLSVTGRNTDARFFTFEIDLIDFGFDVGGTYEISFQRTSLALIDEISAESIRLTRLASCKIIDGSDSIGTTRARLTLTANEQSINIQDRKFNCIATRKCLTYSGGSVVGDLSTGLGLTASQRFADAFLTYFIDSNLANKSVDLLYVDELYSIQNDLDAVFNGKKGQFNFTFDSDSASAQEELYTIADAARVFITKLGSSFDFTRDQAQPSPVRLINRGLKKPGSESKSIKFNQSTDYDGVEFTYPDFDAGERLTIILPNDLPSSDSNYGLTETKNPLKIDGIGIANRDQAWDRAQLEFRKIINNRVRVKVSTGASVATLPLGSRVEYADGTIPANIEGKSDGFVKSVDGLTITTSEECEFITSSDHEVIFTTEDGGTQGPYAVSQLPSTSFGFTLDSAPTEALRIRGESGYQRGTLYIFRATTDTKTAMILQRKTPEDDFYYSCELVNYSDEYYAADGQEPPTL